MRKAPDRSNRYLWFRPETSIIWFRMAVPKDLRVSVGRNYIAESLHTTDIREARIKAGVRRAALLNEWHSDATPVASKIGAPEDLAVTLGFEKMLASMEVGRKEWPLDDSAYAQKAAEREASRRRWIRKLQDGDLTPWEKHADRLIKSHGLGLRKGSDEYHRFVETFASATIDAIGVFSRRLNGDFQAEPQFPSVRESLARGQKKAKPGESILEWFEFWAADLLEKKAKREDTINQDRKRIEQFADFVGRDRALDSITPEEVFAYRELLHDLPPKWASKKELKGLAIVEAAKRARILDLPRTKFTTINQHLSTISPLYKWVAKRPSWAGLKNPCVGLFHEGVKGKNPRPPLSTNALNSLLRSPLFSGFQRNGSEHTPGTCLADDWRKWILLTTMFTGARLGEIAQLRIGDVSEERGIWTVRISEEEKDGLRTKNRKGHLVPLHSTLLSLGFLEFVRRQQDVHEANAPLFAGIERNARGQFGKVSRWYRDYFEAIGIKNGNDGIGPHSFRHTLTDRLRTEAEILDNQIAVILDHSTSSTTGNYGGVPQGTIKMMKEWIEGVSWDGVDFSKIVDSRSGQKIH